MTTLTVLTVCLGNICRSPTAEAALIDAAAEAGLDLQVHSAGTGGWHVGAPPDPRMAEAAAGVGLDLDGEAAQVDTTMLAQADIVFVMDRSNLRDLQRLAASADVSVPIHLFRDFDPQPGDGQVPDPYYGGPDGFAEVVAICRRTAREVIDRLAAGDLIDRTSAIGFRDDVDRPS